MRKGLIAVIILLGCLALVQWCRSGSGTREKMDEKFFREIRRAQKMVISGKRDEGAALVKHAVAIDPTRFRYYDVATAVLGGYEMRKEAIALLEQGVRQVHESGGLFGKSPDNVNRSELYTVLGGEYWRNGSVERAEKAYQAAIRLDAQNTWARNNLGYMYAERGIKLRQALVLTLRAMDMKPKDGMIIDSVGWVYYKLGEKERALEHLQEAVRLLPGDAEIRTHLAMAYEACGNPHAALVEYSKALTIMPRNKTAQVRREKLIVGLSKK